MKDLLISIIVNCADMFTVALYFKMLFGKVRESVSTILYWGIFIAGYSMSVLLQDIFPRYEMVLMLLLTLGLSFVYDVKLSWRVVSVGFYQVIAMISEVFSYGLFVLVTSERAILEISQSWERAMLFTAKLIVLFIIVVINVVRNGTKREGSVTWNCQILLAGIAALSILTVLFEAGFRGENVMKENYPVYVVSILLLFINLFIHKLIDFVVETTEERKQKEKMEFLLQIQQEKYDEISNNFINVNRIIHDVNKHLQFVHFCIEEQEYGNAQEYLEKVGADLKKQYERIHTGNIAIDAMVSDMLMKAKEEHITVVTDIRIERGKVNTERYDICIVLGNLLDNALEAVRGIQETEKRYIEVSIYTSDYGLVFEIVNTVPDGITPDFSNTSKKNKKRHGYGMKNIQSVVEKYGGNLKFRLNQGKVFVTAYIPL